MIKRTKSILSLAIASASLISIMPASAAVQFIEETDGEIRQAISYKDGKYLYEGSKGDNEYGVYYNNGQEDIKLENIDSLYDYSKYRSNYISVTNGRHEDSINLENGTIDENVSTEDDELDAKTKLLSKLKRTNKYGSNVKITSFGQIQNNSYIDEPWYYYEAKGRKSYEQSDEIIEDSEEYVTEFDVSLNSTTETINITGIKFMPAWTNNRLEILAEKIKKVTLNDGYIVRDVDVVGNSITFKLCTNKDINELPKDVISFGDKNNEIDYTELESLGQAWKASVNKADKEFAKEKIKSAVKIEIDNSFWGIVKIAGQEFALDWNKNLYEDLEEKVKNTKFDGYKVLDAKAENTEDKHIGKITIILGSIENLTSVPENIIEGIDYGLNKVLLEKNELDSYLNQSDSTESKEIKSAVKIEIDNSFWGTVKIAGKEFSLDWSKNLYEDLEDKVKNTKFDKYKVLDAKAEDTEDMYIGKITIILGSTEELTSVPENIIEGIDYGLNKVLLEKSELDNYLGKDDNSNEDSSGNSNSKEEVVTYFGFTDRKGNFIDCTKIANIKVFNGYSNVKLQEFDSNKKSNGIKVEIGLPKLIRTLGQDENYIYCVISVDVKNYQSGTQVQYPIDDNSELKFIQKISKAKKNTSDGGANIPNSVNSYLIATMIGADINDWNIYTIEDILGEDNYTNIFIIDEKIFYVSEVVEDGEDKLKYGKIVLRSSEKFEGMDLDGQEKTISYPLVKHDFAATIKADDWCFDKDGNVWTIASGKISKSRQASEFQRIYRVDGLFNRISVYDDNNFVVWDDDGDGFATYFESEKNDEYVKVVGWNKLQDGTWHLYDAKGNETIGWKNYNNTWYYFNNEGVMQTGWIEDNGNKYYLSNSGVMQTGWIKIDEKWYYCDQSGVKQTNTIIDGYSLDSDGIWIQ